MDNNILLEKSGCKRDNLDTTVKAAFQRNLNDIRSSNEKDKDKNLEKKELEIAIQKALESDSRMNVQKRDGLIIFSPKKQDAETGLIVYPGALVDHKSYAPLARAIAIEGFKVALVEMPLNIGILGINKADKVLADKEFANIKKWAIAGHSDGGCMASKYVENKSIIEGIIFWGTFPMVDLSNKNIKGLMIVGSNDGRFADFRKKEYRLPAESEKVIINGGNHANFAYFGRHRGDGPAIISREEQHEIAVKKTVEFLKKL